MNGNKPEYTPHELHPHTDQVTYQNVTTVAGSFGDSGINFTTTTDGNFPIASLQLFPNIYFNSIVWGGFIQKSFDSPTGTQSFNIGFTGHRVELPPTLIHLGLGDEITEAFGLAGALIDQLTLGVTHYPVNPLKDPSFFTVGGFGGSGFDATPPPHLNGVCSLRSLSGQYSTGTYAAINGVEFNWQCVGKPNYFVP